MNSRDMTLMTKEADNNRPLSKEVPSKYVSIKGCVNNAPHSKVATRSSLPNAKDGDNNLPLSKRHVNNILLSKGATRRGLPGTKGAFSKHTLVDNTDSNGVKN